MSWPSTREFLQIPQELTGKNVKNWRQYDIHAVVLTIASTRDTGLLPWQADPIRVLCEQLAFEGLLIIVASGNTTELTCNGPASSPSVLSVGGVIISKGLDINHAKSYHGCRGMTFGGKWVPEILAPAENVVLPLPFRSSDEKMQHFTAPFDNLPEGYARTEGTSFAAPIVLGCAACIWQEHPNWTADQVKSAIISSSNRSSMWGDLDAGVVNVASAVKEVPSKLIMPKPYAIWIEWRNTDEISRLKAMYDQNEEPFLSALLSFYGDQLSDLIADYVQEKMSHQSDKIRAASITVLANCCKRISNSDFRRFLSDDSCFVRMAALFALNHHSDVWHDLTEKIIVLFHDPNLNLRYCAIKLASRINNRVFVEPLISGLHEDAIDQRVSIFGARFEALETICGIAFEPVPEWKEGQCFYSDRSKEARLHIAEKWNRWISTQ